MSEFDRAGLRWERRHGPTVVQARGPERVVYDDPDPAFKAKAVGFTAKLVSVEVEPDLWEGDQA